MATDVDKLVDTLGVQLHMIVETPGNWFNDKGEKSKDSEAVQKLYWTTGAICAICTYHELVMSVWVVEPRNWKGETPKPIMRNRNLTWLQEHRLTLPDRAPTDTSDAIGLARKAGSLWMTNQSARIPLPANWSLVGGMDGWAQIMSTNEIFELLLP